ncbi:MAG: hypothetical protein ACRD0V_18710 [Acidimicrobiales bacterium]
MTAYCDRCGKPGFPTREDAERERDRLTNRDPAAHLQVFACRGSGAGWHVGNRAAPVKGLEWRRCRLLRVTATLRHGAALPHLFPAPLDGIMAAGVLRSRPGFSADVIHPEVVPLPLATSHRGDPELRPDLGKRWVWAATCAQYPRDTPEDVRWFHKRFRDQIAEQVVTNVPTTTVSGRYKDWRLPLVVTLAAELTWWALGDPEQVLAILRTVEQVGRKRSQGEGVVARWDVRDTGPPEWEPILWQQGRAARPLAARAAAGIGVPDADTIPHSYRPPYFLPRHVAQDDEGRPGLEWPEVIAPWTTRPARSVS